MINHKPTNHTRNARVLVAQILATATTTSATVQAALTQAEAQKKHDAIARNSHNARADANNVTRDEE